MEKPRGIDLLATLIDLLADQEGVNISYELISKSGEVRTKTHAAARKKGKHERGDVNGRSA